MSGNLHAICAATYAALAAFVLLRTPRQPVPRCPLLAACLLTVLWAGAGRGAAGGQSARRRGRG